jgi:asparagine synthase (glutamine-hydrolysing)
MFGGYRRYRMHLMEERMRAALPASVCAARCSACSAACTPRPTGRRGSLRAKTTFEGMARTGGRGLLPFGVDPARPDAGRNCSALRLKRELAGYDAMSGVRAPCRSRARTDDPLALIQYLDIKTYLVGDINTKVDRASMAHSASRCASR